MDGKYEEGEKPEDSVMREVREDAGQTPTDWRYRGADAFVSDQSETELMHLFTADGFVGELKDCDEGELAWVPLERMAELPQWEGDRIFLRLLAEEEPFFSLKLIYRGDKLTGAVLNGRKNLME